MSAEEALQHEWISSKKNMRRLAVRLIRYVGPANDKNAKRKQSDHDSRVSGKQEKRTRSKTVRIQMWKQCVKLYSPSYA